MRKQYLFTEIITERKLSNFKARLDAYIQHLQSQGHLFEIQFSTDAMGYNALILGYKLLE
ncbi:hypothetical protein [Paenibacillus ihuae]|uniref:hypothetical protein n=1 Tax=Paenibacillus ihuae TaxID=1232431 RepID=UPI0006D59123|nr:hypothetical protein [Paenibacillus ihuae]